LSRVVGKARSAVFAKPWRTFKSWDLNGPRAAPLKEPEEEKKKGDLG